MWRTKSFTPIFNTPYFASKMQLNGGIDKSFHNRILETILFPKRAISIVNIEKDIAEISTGEYEEQGIWYTKASFLEKGEEEDKEPLPSKKLLIKRLWEFPKLPYLLGGTTPFPVEFEYLVSEDPFINRHKKLFGIDCSGLLYYVSGGNTPRNTSGLFKIGKQVQNLEPLDLILFPGHVIIYLGDGFCIESREIDGVCISNWESRKESIKSAYTFIRWYP